MPSYEIIMGITVSHTENPINLAVAKATEILKNNIEDASVMDVVVYDDDIYEGPNDALGVGIDFKTSKELDWHEVTDGIEKAETLEQIG